MKIVNKLIAGSLATIPMTIFMMQSFKILNNKNKYPLPPRVISMNMAQNVGIRKNLNESNRLALTYFNHFTYGAIAALLYFPIAKKIKLSNQSSGIGYGLLVWGFSYLGLLPSLKLYRPIKSEPLERNILMIISHVVWGSSLGLLRDILTKENWESNESK